MSALRTITVEKLRELLEGEPPDAKVIFAADYGDRGHTLQALPIEGSVEGVSLRETAYSTSGWAVNDDEDDEPDSWEDRVVLIR